MNRNIQPEPQNLKHRLVLRQSSCIFASLLKIENGVLIERISSDIICLMCLYPLMG